MDTRVLILETNKFALSTHSYQPNPGLADGLFTEYWGYKQLRPSTSRFEGIISSTLLFGEDPIPSSPRKSPPMQRTFIGQLLTESLVTLARQWPPADGRRRIRPKRRWQDRWRQILRRRASIGCEDLRTIDIRDGKVLELCKNEPNRNSGFTKNRTRK